MIAFEISRNGQHVCLAGMAGPCVLTSMTNLLIPEPDCEPPLGSDEPFGDEPFLSMRIAGLSSGGTDEGTHYTWARLDLQTGDEITLKIREVTACDAPIETKEKDHDEHLAYEQNRVRKLCAKWGWKIKEDGDL